MADKNPGIKKIATGNFGRSMTAPGTAQPVTKADQKHELTGDQKKLMSRSCHTGSTGARPKEMTHNHGPTRQAWTKSTSTTTVHKVKPDVDSRSKEIDQLPDMYDAESSPDDKDLQRVAKSKPPDNTYKDTAQAQVQPETISPKISLTVAYNCTTSDTRWKEIDLAVKCNLVTYMKWKYMLYSPTSLDSCQKQLIKKDGSIDLQTRPKLMLTIGKKVENEQALPVITKGVVKFVTEFDKSLIVETFEIRNNMADQCAQSVMSSIVGSTHFCYAEAIENDKLCMVYMDSKAPTIKQRVADLLKLTLKPEGQMSSVTITLDEIWIKISEKIKLKDRILKCSPNVKVAFGEVGNKCICQMEGSPEELKTAQEKLQHFQSRLKSRKCNILLKGMQLLGKLDICCIIEQMLDERGLWVVLTWSANDILAFGFDDAVLLKAALKVKSFLSEFELSIPAHWTDQNKMNEIQKYMTKSCPEKVISKFNSERGVVYIVGIKDEVLKAVKLAGEGMSQKHSSYMVEDSKLFLAMKQIAPKIEEECCITISLLKDHKMQGLELCGLEENLKKAIVRLNEVKTNFQLPENEESNFEVLIKVPVEFYESEAGKDCIKNEEKERRVIIEKIRENVVIEGATSENAEMTYEAPSITVERKEEKEKIQWSFSKKRQILLMKGLLKECGATIQVYPDEKKQHRGSQISKPIKLEGNLFVEVEIPLWKDGKHNEIQKFDGLLIRMLTKVVEDKEESVGIALDTSETWPKDIYLESVVEAISRFFKQNQKDKGHLSVVLVTNKDTAFNLTTQYIDDHLKSTSEVKNTEEVSRLKVEIKSGELNKTMADVLVNTVSPDLDLKAGTVSAAILRSAGHGIQEECRKLYPEGLMDNVIVVTDGYKLPCKLVLHGYLNKFDPQQEGECYKQLQTFMITCLKTASDYKQRSIAFPALGTGRLAYPYDMVASVMHTAVEMFSRDYKETTIKEVIFVLYPADLKVYKEFQLVNHSIGMLVNLSVHKLTTLSAKHNKPKELTNKQMCLKICGLEIDVVEANAVLKQKVEQMTKAKVSSTSRIAIVQTILGVPRIVYIAFKSLHSETVKQLKSDGVKFIHKHDKLELKVQTTELISAIEDVKRLMREIQDLDQVKIKVEPKYSEEINQAIADINSKNPNVKSLFCILDPVGNEIVIFGHSTSEIKEMQNELQSKLSISSEFKSDSFTNELGVAKSKDYEDNFTGPSLRTKPLVGRSFSWSKHTKNMRAYQAGQLVIKVYEANILYAPVQCIVNAANEDLQHCGGIALAIARAAGDDLSRESQDIIRHRKGPLKVGEVVPTSAGKLELECVLHAVGPCWGDYKPITEESLRACENDLFTAVNGCLEEAGRMGLRSIAIPAISSAIFQVPKDICCEQYVKAIQQFSMKKSNLEEIHFVDIDVKMVQTIQSTFQTMITDGKPSPYNSRVYIESSNKNTGRSKPNRHSKELQSESPMPMVQMKTIGNKISYTFTKSCSLLVYTGNILTIDNVDVMVCSEDCTGKAGGIVAKKLLTIGGTEYANDKNRKFYNKPQLGEVLITKGGKSRFKRIMHAIVTKRAPEMLFQLFENIFEEAYRQRFTTVAMPLLGTGAGKSSPEPIAGMLLDSFHGFCKTHTNASITVHVVNIVPETTQIVNRKFQERIGELQQRQGMHGATSTYSESIAFGDEAVETHGPASMTSRRDSGTFVDKPSSHRQLPDIPTAQNDTVGDKEMTSSQPDSTATEDNCVICMDKVDKPKKLKCGHIFCTDCIDQYFQVKPACPTCGAVCGTVTGDQPDGEMEIMKMKDHVPGYERYATLAMTYCFEDGYQKDHHPRPKAWYKGISRTAYLPCNEEGQKICAMLREAFNRKLVFTIGTSRTTGQEGVITWNDIHHKTDHRPNTQFGYPDPTYMARVTDELAAKGVTEEDIDKDFLKSIKTLSGSKRLRN